MSFNSYFAVAMRKGKPLLFVVPITICLSMVCKERATLVSKDEISVAFYNLDNLFDDVDDPGPGDDEFTRSGKYQWSSQRYHQKLENMEKVIAQMVDGAMPDALGVCELESAKALNDLISTGKLRSHYGLVHHDSPDERGIDVGFIYNKSKLSVIADKTFSVSLSKDSSDRTRDILLVTCKTLTGDTLSFFICHFPSRREGKAESEQNRLDAAAVLKRETDQLPSGSQFIIMGDFNDQPKDNSLSKVLKAENYKDNPQAGLFNLMYELPSETPGSYFFRNHWEKLDQIMISASLRDGSDPDYLNHSVGVMKHDWMIQKGKFEGYPLRTFGGNNWLNGFSDHLPVYMIIKLKHNGKS